MKRQILMLGAVLAWVALVGVMFLSAQAPTRIIVKMNFPFTAGMANLPAGQYTIEEDSPNIIHVHTLDVKANPQATLVVITRLASITPDRPPTVVFDHIGDKYVLSEVWMPGEDGFLVSTAKEAHTHETVSGSKAK